MSDVFNNKSLDLFASQSLLFKQNTGISVTGFTTEQKVYSVLIPAGTFSANDTLRFNIMYGLLTNNANVKTARVYINDTDDLVTPTLIATRTLTSLANANHLRNLVFQNSLTSQIITSASANLTNDEVSNGVNMSTLTIDFSIDQYFIISFEQAVSTDTMGIRYITGEIKR